MSQNKQQGVKSDVLGRPSATVKELFGGVDLMPKTFNSGKVGYRTNATLDLKCGKRTYKFAAGLNVVAIDSAKNPLADEDRQAILEGGPRSLKDLGIGSIEAAPRTFSTSSVGLYAGDKREILLSNGHRVKFQVNVLVTAAHSAEWPAEEAEGSEDAESAQQ